MSHIDLAFLTAAVGWRPQRLDITRTLHSNGNKETETIAANVKIKEQKQNKK